ncbi:MAG: hypothetical protein WDN00_01035 [Limisphaerales bacterium]
MPFVLRQVVGDLKPWRLVTDKDMRGWPDARGLNKCSHGHVYKGAFVDDRIQKRAADLAVDIMVGGRITENQNLFLALGDLQLAALDTGKGFEGRTGRAPAIRAMAVQGIFEFIRHGIVNCTAQAFSDECLTSHLPGTVFVSVIPRDTASISSRILPGRQWLPAMPRQQTVFNPGRSRWAGGLEKVIETMHASVQEIFIVFADPEMNLPFNFGPSVFQFSEQKRVRS